MTDRFSLRTKTPSLIYATILAVAVGYYCYCSFTGRSVYSFGQNNTWQNDTSPGGSDSHRRTRVHSFHHK